MANVLVGRRVVQSKQIVTGTAEVFNVKAGQLVQIIDMAGAQVAAMVVDSDISALGNVEVTAGSDREVDMVALTGETSFDDMDDA